MNRALANILWTVLVAIAFFAVSCSREEVVVKQRKGDRTPSWNYLFDTQDRTRVFFNDGRVLSFWFKKGRKESTFKVYNPVFKVGGDLKPRHRYAIIGNELFATYRIIDDTSGEKVSKSYLYYLYLIKGLDQVSMPIIEPLGSFSRENREFIQMVRIDKYFVALTYDFAAQTKMIEVYDKYKRPMAQYPAIKQSNSLCYSGSKNMLYFVNADGLLTQLSMDTLYPTTFSFDQPLPEFDPEWVKHSVLPFALIFPKDQGLNHLYYVIPHNQEGSFLLKADLSTKKVQLVAELPGPYIIAAGSFNERFVYLGYFSAPPQGETAWNLFDTIDKKLIPLKGIFYPYPRWCITLERPRSTPYLVERINDDYNLKFFENFAFDDTSIDLIRK